MLERYYKSMPADGSRDPELMRIYKQLSGHPPLLTVGLELPSRQVKVILLEKKSPAADGKERAFLKE